jgi:bifunctional UDP-N-acetylglucosamine pyrophosphorylase/glucosamine-1-phosphate N-acetyltransferase
MSGKSQDGFFKIRQTKRSNPEERTTLDVIHQHQLKKIIEEKDCNEEQKLISEINSGIYLFSGFSLHSFLPKITNQNKQGEYYLTDIVKIAKEQGNTIHTFLIDKEDNYQIKGANTPEELNELHHYCE